MIHILDLSSFVTLEIIKNLGRDLLSNIAERISEMKNLRSMVLVNCSLDDSYNQTFEKLFLVKSITRYNLSKNRLGHLFVNLLSKSIR